MTTFQLSKISASSFDISEHIDTVPHLEMQAHLHKGIINNVDFLIKSAVYAAFKYIREDVIDVKTFATHQEIALAVDELNLAEHSFFEAGSSNSLVDTVKHLHELRGELAAKAEAADELVNGGRPTVAALWAQAEKKTYKVLDLEEQFMTPTFRTSADQQRKIRTEVVRQCKRDNIDDETTDKRVKEALTREEIMNLDSEKAMVDKAPIYCMLLANILRQDTSVFNETDTSDGYSSEGVPRRRTWVGEISFVTLPYQVRSLIISKSIADAETFKTWRMRDRKVSCEAMTAISNLVDKYESDLESVLRSPAFKQAAAVATV